jgi:hypothetical protein
MDVSDRNALTREREAAREASATALGLLREVLARVGDGFVALDSQGVYTYANERAADLLGLPSARALLGKTQALVIQESPDLPYVEGCERAMQAQQADISETFHARTGRWIESRVYPGPDGLSIYFSDITMRRKAQDDLVASERNFRLLAEQLPAIVYRTRLSGVGSADFVSPRISELGFTPEEWVSRPGLIWELMHPADRERVRQEVEDALAAGRDLLLLDYQLRNPDGSWRQVSDRSRVIRPANGDPAFLLGVSLDVTEAHVARVAVVRSEAQYRRLAEQVPAIIYRAQLESGRPALFVSPHVATLGYTVKQWTSEAGPNWHSVLHPDDASRVLEQVRHALLSGIETTLEYRLRDAWGHWRDFIDHGRVVDADEPGESLRQGVMLEITELKRTELALREAEADQRSLFEALADGVLVLDADHRIVDANAAAAKLLGYPLDELLKLRLEDLLPEAERGRAHEVVRALVGAAGPHFIEWDTRRRDGSTFPAEVSARRASGQRTVEVLRDVTERRAAERALLTYQQQLSDLTQRLMTQERETSRHLAQSLHDHLGQSLAVARLRLDATLVGHADLLTAALRQECERLGLTLDRAIADVRRVLGDLRPTLLEDQGLLAALDNEVRTRALGDASVDVLLELDEGGLQARWPADVEYSAFMIAREAIANAQLHAQASLVRVIVTGDRHRLRLEVIPDGVGIADEVRAGRPGHLGLVGMRERAQAIGAQVSVEQPGEGGTRVLLLWQEALS